MSTLTRFVTGAALAVATSLSLSVHAQYSGPAGEPPVTQVQSILQAPQDDQDVVLRGHLLRKLDDEKYVFSDGTGEIIAEIDDDEFPDVPVNEATPVELRGEVDTGRNRAPEIDVESVRALTAG
ncbi:NirD/YgiW/YdeI family stress tolerance protein [bacterium SGD-2]|nr:NirD/YgiW/YdeI family stress tolerance protein [bacterium SGD-2]